VNVAKELQEPSKQSWGMTALSLLLEQWGQQEKASTKQS